MEVTNELLEKWEPKVHSMLHTVQPQDYEDVAQEMRLAVLRAARGFREGAGASFHTYLHWAMVNARNTFFTKNYQKQPITTPLDPVEHEYLLADVEHPFLTDVPLTEEEQQVVFLLTQGFSFSDLRREGFEATKLQHIRRSLKEKFTPLLHDYQV